MQLASDLAVHRETPGWRGRHYCKQSRYSSRIHSLLSRCTNAPGSGKLRAFGEQGLLVDHQRQLAEVLGVLALLQILHEVMLDVELEHRLAGRRLLPGRFQHAPQRRGHVVLAGDQHRGGILEPRAHAHLGDAVAERILDPLEQRLAFLELRLGLFLVGGAREPAELQIAARGVLEFLAFEVLQVVHDPGVDAPA